MMGLQMEQKIGSWKGSQMFAISIKIILQKNEYDDSLLLDDLDELEFFSDKQIIKHILSS